MLTPDPGPSRATPCARAPSAENSQTPAPRRAEVKKVLVDGREQSLPESDPEIIEQKEANVTVPAGTYQSIYLKIKDNAQNGAISEMWVNPRDIPISGMLKSIQDSQLGKVTIELVSFIKK